MEKPYTLRRAVRVALTLSFAIFCSALSSASAEDDPSWHGQGWYVVKGDDWGINLIYAGPYASQKACFDRVDKYTSDTPWMTNMYKKYGQYGDGKNEWQFYCPYLKTAGSADDSNNWSRGPD